MSGALSWRPTADGRGHGRSALPSRSEQIDERATSIDEGLSWGGWWSAEAERSGVRDVRVSEARVSDVRVSDVRVSDARDSQDQVAAAGGSESRRSQARSSDARLPERRMSDVEGDAGVPVNGTTSVAVHQVTARDLPDGITVTSASVQLTRRKPQASLAPELRRGQQVTAPTTAPQVQPSDASRARDALSRYQVSRQAAMAKNKDTSGGDK
jgi:hypothetical protein